jgi:hypothetical protein
MSKEPFLNNTDYLIYFSRELIEGLSLSLIFSIPLLYICIKWATYLLKEEVLATKRALKKK